jgi:hypothetical protein
MSNVEEDNISEFKTIGPGDILSFGSVNLLFTLNLEKEDINKYDIKWEKLESLKNLKFIIKHKSLWKRVELSSTSDSINILLQINQSSKKLLKLGYVGFKKITYKDEQVDFEDLIETITRQNGLYITSCDVCKSTVSIQLLLKFKDKQKIFVLSGISTPITNEEKKDKDNNNKAEEKKNDKNDDTGDKNIDENKDNKNNTGNEDVKQEKENKSEEEDQDNPLYNITDDVINPADFSYLYFNFSDFISGEFCGRIKIEHLYEYFQHLKIKTKSKIILNLNDEKIDNNDEIIKDLLSITDMYIFYNKNKLYNILKQMKEIEDQTELKKVHENHLNAIKRKLEEEEENKEKEKELIENYKNFLEKEKEKNNKKEKRIYNSVRREKANLKRNIYITQTQSNSKEKDKEINRINQTINNSELNQKKTMPAKRRMNTESDKNNNGNKRGSSINLKNVKIRLMPMKPPAPKPLDKKEMFDYFKCGICDKDPQKKSQDKVALVMDEFKKIFFIKFNKKDEKPSVLDFDLKLYPQMNLRNMNDILESKKCIQSNFNDYSKTFFGSLLSTIVSKGQEGCEENSLFLGYLVAMNTIKKMVEIQKYNLPMPKNKDFFSPSIKKGEVKKLITEANQRRKEQLFVLDGNTKKNIGIKPYNPLLDKNLASFFSSRQNFLKMNGIIGKDGEILYDPVYRDTLQNTRSNNFENKFMPISPQKKKNKDNSKNNNKNNFKYKSLTTNKFLFGFRRRSPGYSIYNENRKNNNLVLPFISTIEKNRRKNYYKSKSRIRRERSKEDDSSGKEE